LALPLPPPQPDLCLPFAEIESHSAVDAVMPDGEVDPRLKDWLKSGRLKFRIGRCGRVLLDQIDQENEQQAAGDDNNGKKEEPGGYNEQTDALQQRLQKLLLLV
jgi:hypothetical protein